MRINTMTQVPLIMLLFFFKNRNWNYLDKHGTAFTFSALVPLNESMSFFFFYSFSLLSISPNYEYWIISWEMVQKYCKYHPLHLLPSTFLFQPTFTFSFHSWREKRTKRHESCSFISLLSFIPPNIQLIPGYHHFNEESFCSALLPQAL